MGKLQFVANCVQLGWLFVSRLLQELKAMNRTFRYKLDQQARKDIQWWYEFLPDFDGECIMWLLEKSEVDSELAVDACMEGAGGITQMHYFHVKFPQKFKEQDLKITHLELWVVIVAVKV